MNQHSDFVTYTDYGIEIKDRIIYSYPSRQVLKMKKRERLAKEKIRNS